MDRPPWNEHIFCSKGLGNELTRLQGASLCLGNVLSATLISPHTLSSYNANDGVRQFSPMGNLPKYAKRGKFVVLLEGVAKRNWDPRRFVVR